MVFRAIVLFYCGYNKETCKIIETTFLTLYFAQCEIFRRSKGAGGGHGPIGPMVNTPVPASHPASHIAVASTGSAQTRTGGVLGAVPSAAV